MSVYEERMKDLIKHKDMYNQKQYAELISYGQSNQKGYAVPNQKELQAKEAAANAEIAKKKRIVDYLKKAKESAIRRGVYNQNVYNSIEKEAENNV